MEIHAEEARGDFRRPSTRAMTCSAVSSNASRKSRKLPPGRANGSAAKPVAAKKPINKKKAAVKRAPTMAAAEKKVPRAYKPGASLRQDGKSRPYPPI